jgi:hypothetical protein
MVKVVPGFPNRLGVGTTARYRLPLNALGFQRPFGQVWSGERKPVEIHVLRHGYNQSLAYYWKVQSVGSALSLPILFMNGLLTNTDATGALGNYIPLTNRQLDAFQL